ncbi:MAG: DUF4126 domain-containing protein [Geminicoccaceae bacterium]
MTGLEANVLPLMTAWGTGINPYLTVLLLSGAGMLGVVDLPSGLDWLAEPNVLAIVAALTALHFLIDKVPGIDSLWDAANALGKVPAGAALAGMAASDAGLASQAVFALAGGGLATAAVATKAGSRALINTSPEPFSNWFASITEDVAVILGISVVFIAPALAAVLLIVFVVLMLWLLPRLWRGLKLIGRRLSGRTAPVPPAPEPPPG